MTLPPWEGREQVVRKTQLTALFPEQERELDAM
jgi:hypothetical protein